MSGERNPVFDGLKLLSAASIVLLHVAGSYPAHRGHFLSGFVTSATYGALFVFFGVSGYFHGSVGTRGWKWLAQRFERLAVPYAVWSGAYLIWDYYHAIQPPKWVNVLFFAGANELLWSLPMLFISATLAELFARTRRRRQILLVVLGALSVASCLLLPPQWYANAARQFIWGVRWPFMYVLGMEIRAARLKSAGWVLPAVALVAILLSGVLGAFDLTEYPLRLYTLQATVIYAVGAAALLLAAHAGFRWFGVERLAWGGQFLLGIYVSHYLWLNWVLRVLPTSAMRMRVWVPVVWVGVFGAALATSWVLRSIRSTRAFVA